MPMDFPNSPVVGQVFSSGSRQWVWTGTTWDSPAAGTPGIVSSTGGTFTGDITAPNYAGRGNVIINGAFDIWQRGTSFTTTNTYTADRWSMVVAGTGSAVVSQQAFSPGAAPVAGYESAHFLRYASTNVQDPRILQPIEDVRTFAGQTVTVSFWAKSNISDALAGNSINLQQNFGSGGSTFVSTTVSGPTLTADWERYSFTLSLPSISGKTIGANSNLRLQLSFKGSATFNVDIWGVQVEAGSTATPFRRNANSLQGELAACQRYAKVYNGTETDIIGFAFSTTGGQYYLKLPTTMRAAPSLSGVVASNFIVYNSGFSNGNPTALTLNSSNIESVTLNTTTTAGSPTIAQNQPVKLVGTASAQIILSAEL